MFMRVNANGAHQLRPSLKAVDPERVAEALRCRPAAEATAESRVKPGPARLRPALRR
jgi:hypothetical protein